MLKKLTIFCLITLFLISTMLFSYQKNVSAIQNVWMEIIPRKINSSSIHKWHFTIEKLLEVHQAITLFFGEGTTLVPPLPEDPIKLKERLTQIIESMSIGLSPCSACQGLPILRFRKDGSLEALTFNTHIELNPEIEGYSDIVVTAAAVCGFTTPAKPGFYTYGVSTGAEPSKVNSAPFEIVETRIGIPEGIPEVIVDPPVFNATAKYTISFNVGRGGWLQGSASIIKIRFPEQTRFLKPFNEIVPENILVNGMPVSNRINGLKNIINFTNPVEVKDSGRVVIEFNEKVGIKNPSDRGEYIIEVATSSEGDWVASTPYLIQTGVSSLKVTPPKIGRVAEYIISFGLTVPELKKEKAIYIKFPDSVTLPSYINKENVLINTKIPFKVEINKSEILVYTNDDLKINDGVEIVFSKDCGIKNPTTATKIQIQYRPFNYQQYESTPLIDIVVGKLEVGEITIDPKNADEIASYKIPVTLGDNDPLDFDSFGYIAVKFPEETYIPDGINRGLYIRDVESGKYIPIDTVAILMDSIGLWVGESVAGGKSLMIEFEKEAGIRNPKIVKEYTLSVFTENDGPVNSESYKILPPLPVSNIEVRGGKKGNDNWYIEPPLVSFTCNDPTAEIILYWDKKINQPIVYDGIEKPLDLGQYESNLYYYSKTAYGQESLKEHTFKVDTVQPEYVIENPKEARMLVNKNPLLITGRTTQIKTILYGDEILTYDKIILINGHTLEVSDIDGSFSFEFEMEQGSNKINVRGEDIAGNFLEKNFDIELDDIPPTLEISEPKSLSVIKTSKFQIKGITEPEVQLLINGEIVYVESDGSFIFDDISDEIGKIKYEIQATDRAGNIIEKSIEFWLGYTIILQVSNKKASINEEDKTLDVAPYIKNGRTFVPVRFIGEALGASINPIINPKTKMVSQVIYELGSIKIVLTIGSKEATVNGRKVILEVPPEIIKGRTFVPVRFVSENLGASVGWEAKEEKITIRYLQIK